MACFKNMKIPMRIPREKVDNYNLVDWINWIKFLTTVFCWSLR